MILNPYRYAGFNPLADGHLDHAYSAASAQHSGTGTDLTQWDDLVGSLDLTATPATMPSFEAVAATLNSQPAVRCNSESIWSTDTGTIYDQPVTRLLVAECVSIDTANRAFFDSATATYRFAWYTQSGKFRLFTDTVGVTARNSPTAADVFCAWAVVSGTSSRVRYNGTTSANVDAGTEQCRGITLGGAFGGVNFQDCRIVYAAQGEGDLLADQASWVSEVESWADDKWSLGGWS